MLNKRFNAIKELKKYEKYYYNLLLNNNYNNNLYSIYKVGYPIFYREVYDFWLVGQTVKIVRKNYKLNEIIKFKASIDKSKFIIFIPLQLPYLLFS